MRWLSLAVLASLLLAASAAAGPAPALYFLQDGATGPIGDGSMDATAPDSLEPSTRPIAVGSSDLPSAIFVGPEAPEDRVYGPLFVAVWLGPSLVVEGNLTAAAYIEDAEGERSLLATGSESVNTNLSSTPDPMAFVPPDPTDPEAALAHVMSQALAQTLQPPVVLDLGLVDAEVPEGSHISIGLYLEAPDGGLLPIGAASAQYDGQLQPSFAWVPWYAPDPPAPTSNPSSSPSGPPPSSPSPSGGSSPTSQPDPSPGSDGMADEGPDTQDSPGIGAIALLAFVAVAALAARRR